MKGLQKEEGMLNEEMEISKIKINFVLNKNRNGVKGGEENKDLNR